MEEIGNPSVSLLRLIDQSDMMNSPPPPHYKTLYGVIEGWQACRKEVVYRMEWEVTASSEWGRRMALH